MQGESYSNGDGDFRQLNEDANHRKSKLQSAVCHLRLFWWKCTYTLLNFDAWILSKSYEFGKRKILISAFILYCAIFLHVNSELLKDPIMQLFKGMKDKSEKAYFNEIADLRTDFKSFSEDTEEFIKNIANTVERFRSTTPLVEQLGELDVENLKYKIKKLETEVEKIEISIQALANVCNENLKIQSFFENFSRQYADDLRNIAEKEKGNIKSSYRLFQEWLYSKFIYQRAFINKINAAIREFSERFAEIDEKRQQENNQKHIQDFLKGYMETVKTNLYHSYDCISVDEAKRIIKESIQLYNADQNGLADYALESGGGRIISTRCSETFYRDNTRQYLFTWPLWYDYRSPNLAIQPEVRPGTCWPFKGVHGFLAIQLSATIYPSGFSLEHIPKSVALNGSLSSAPKDFTVWGLDSETDVNRKLLGKYKYDIDGEPLQYFDLQSSKKFPCFFVELEIMSNYGNPLYTCLYRFRVHGTPV